MVHVETARHGHHLLPLSCSLTGVWIGDDPADLLQPVQEDFRCTRVQRARQVEELNARLAKDKSWLTCPSQTWLEQWHGKPHGRVLQSILQSCIVRQTELASMPTCMPPCGPVTTSTCVAFNSEQHVSSLEV